MQYLDKDKNLLQYSDYLIFGDETGDHGLVSIDEEYPIFGLIFVIIHKEEYIKNFVPKIQELKIKYWGHDQIILHEHDIRKPKKQSPFLILNQSKKVREEFHTELSEIIQETDFQWVATIIDKHKLKERYPDPYNPYEISLLFCLERIDCCIKTQTLGKTAHIALESRGGKEDKSLEAEFLAIKENRTKLGNFYYNLKEVDYRLNIVSKKVNSSGMQLADLCARPIGNSYLKKDQKNRAFEVIKDKCYKKKIFP